MAGKVGAVLVLGGGIAGMQTSLDLAESGFKVYLVEKTGSIGGGNIAPTLVGTGRHHNIEIITCSEIEGVEGDVGYFSVSVLKHPRYIDENKCTGCGVCAQYCPI